jgi:hypothetical protein
MRARKLLKQTLGLLGVTREELEHLVACALCIDPFDSADGYHCDVYVEKFWGYTRPKPHELTPQQQANAKMIQDLWAPEIIRQAQAGSLFRSMFPEHVSGSRTDGLTQMPPVLKFGEESNAPGTEA